MLLSDEAEYIDENGEYKYIDVDFEGKPRWENDSFSHEFGIQRYPDYPIVDEDIIWDKSKYTDWQNEFIAAHLKKHEKRISDVFCDILRKEREEHEWW